MKSQNWTVKESQAILGVVYKNVLVMKEIELELSRRKTKELELKVWCTDSTALLNVPKFLDHRFC